MFPCEYWDIFKNSFFIEHLRWLPLTIHCEHLLFQISNQQACFIDWSKNFRELAKLSDILDWNDEIF